MNPSTKRRTMAWGGIIVLTVLFILTIVFLLAGNMALAVTMIALNGLVLFIIFFTVRFNQNIHDQNPELFPDEDDEEDDGQ